MLAPRTLGRCARRAHLARVNSASALAQSLSFSRSTLPPIQQLYASASSALRVSHTSARGGRGGGRSRGSRASDWRTRRSSSAGRAAPPAPPPPPRTRRKARELGRPGRRLGEAPDAVVAPVGVVAVLVVLLDLHAARPRALRAHQRDLQPPAARGAGWAGGWVGGSGWGANVERGRVARTRDHPTRGAAAAPPEVRHGPRLPPPPSPAPGVGDHGHLQLLLLVAPAAVQELERLIQRAQAARAVHPAGCVCGGAGGGGG